MWLLSPRLRSEPWTLDPAGRAVPSPCTMSRTALVLHPLLLARPTPDTTYTAENQAGSLRCSCCLPPRSSPGCRSPGSGLHGHMSPVGLPAPGLARRGAAPGQNGAGASPFPKFPQAERAALSAGSDPDQTILPVQFCRCCWHLALAFSKKIRKASARKKKGAPKKANRIT